jgi:histidinol phosphatase-like PHP family hydrolase
MFLGTVAAALPAAAPPVPVVDFHVHLSPNFPLEDAVALSRKTNVKFGILEHAGTKENQYRAILTNDAELRQWIARLDGKPVYKGIQAEWLDWSTCFSKEAVAQLDFVLSDAMTIPGRNGERAKMWVPGFDPGDAKAFMERYVKWNVEVIEKEPLDIFAHPTWLPAPLDRQFDELWTEERMMPIIQALRRTGTAVEIDSHYKIPHMPFLKMAKEARLKFAYGSNSGSGPARGIDFCVETARALGLRASDMFMPAATQRKPILRRKIIG